MDIFVCAVMVLRPILFIALLHAIHTKGMVAIGWKIVLDNVKKYNTLKGMYWGRVF